MIMLATLILVLCSSIMAQSSVERLKDGNRARNAGNLSEAEAIYRSLLEDPALDEAAREALGQVLSWQGKFDEAIEQYRELRRRYPQRALEADIGMARSYAWGGKHRQAVEVAERGLIEDPDNPDLLLLLGQVESWSGHTKKSVAAFDRLLEIDPINRKALLGRARALSWSGDFVKAERQFRAILAENPGDIEARVALVHNLIWMGRHKDASDIWEKFDQKDISRRDVRVAKVALARALGNRVEYRQELESLRNEYPGDNDVRRFTRLEVNELGPHLRTRALYLNDSDELEIMQYVIAGSFTLTPSTYLFFEGLRKDISFPGDPDVYADGITLGFDTALVQGIIMRLWGGSRMAEDADNEAVGGARMLFRPRSNMRLSAGYEESYADYTPQAVRNNVRQKTADLRLFLSATPRLSVTGTVMSRRYKSDIFSQRRDLIDASVRWALPGQGRLRTAVGLRGKYFRFDEAELDTGYYNPSDFRRFLAFVTFTRRHRERTRVVLDLAYGTKQVGDRSWESAGAASFVVSVPIGEKVDLIGHFDYSRLSITTGNYSSRSASLGLLFRLK